MDHMINDIRGSFDIQDLGEPERLLGVKIARNRNKGHIHISQPAYIDSLAKRFNITAGKSITSPMETSIDLRASTIVDNSINILYASLIGSINYCATFTRPDISFAIHKCSQFISKPTEEHWVAAKRILRYLINTKNNGILYKSQGTGISGYAHHLAGFTDADFAGDVNDRKSTSGWIYTYNGAPISWSSKKQNIVTRSMMEAELVAGSFASVEGIWLLKLGKDFNLMFKPIPLFADNKSFILFSKNDINNNRTKHIDTHYHYTKEQMNAGNITLHYIPSCENPADMLTKALPSRKHQHLLNALGICFAWGGVLWTDKPILNLSYTFHSNNMFTNFTSRLKYSYQHHLLTYRHDPSPILFVYITTIITTRHLRLHIDIYIDKRTGDSIYAIGGDFTLFIVSFSFHHKWRYNLSLYDSQTRHRHSPRTSWPLHDTITLFHKNSHDIINPSLPYVHMYKICL